MFGLIAKFYKKSPVPTSLEKCKTSSLFYKLKFSKTKKILNPCENQQTNNA